MTSSENRTIFKVVNISECMGGRCSYSIMPNSYLLNDYPPSSYYKMSVAAENVVGVGGARTCTAQTISELNLTICTVFVLGISFYTLPEQQFLPEF